MIVFTGKISMWLVFKNDTNSPYLNLWNPFNHWPKIYSNFPAYLRSLLSRLARSGGINNTKSIKKCGTTHCLSFQSTYEAHYNNVIITSLTIVYWTVYSRRTSKKISKLCVTGLCARNSPGTGEFPAQRTSDAESVSIWWRHHAL